jgi:hypothetical protein
MLFRQAGQYPHCNSYICTVIASYSGVCSPAADAFRAICEDEALAGQALTPGRNPLVHIGGVECAVNGEYRGRSGGPRNTVFINTRVAEEYEIFGRWDIFESTVLHEMVHWARFVGGRASQYDGQEAGKVFEVRAYGRDISCGCYNSCESP